LSGTAIRLTQGLIDGISIGYEVEPGGAIYNKQGHRELHTLRLWEISGVTWPANDEARVTSVKERGDASSIIAALKAGSLSFKSDNDHEILRAVSETLAGIAQDEAADLASDMLDRIGSRLANLERLNS
jgi:hypothetical protein